MEGKTELNERESMWVSPGGLGELPACQKGAFGRAKGCSPAWSILRGLGRAGRNIFSRAGLLICPQRGRRHGCGGLGVVLVSVGTRGGFLVYLGVQQHGKQGFYSWQANKTLALGGNIFKKGFPCSAPPSPGCERLCRAHSRGCSQRVGLSLTGHPGLSVASRDFCSVCGQATLRLLQPAGQVVPGPVALCGSQPLRQRHRGAGGVGEPGWRGAAAGIRAASRLQDTPRSVALLHPV